MTLLILLVVVVAVALRISTPEDRSRFLGAAASVARRVGKKATERRPECEAFRAALRERTPRPYVTMALAAIIAGTALARAPIDPWGNPALQTTNGEWWRLVTAAFVHAGLFTALLNLAVLVQLGRILERLVGHAAFAAVFLASAVFANLVHLATQPLAVGAGASGAVFGLYGLLAGVLVWSVRRPRGIAIPAATISTIGTGAAFFVLISLANGSLAAAAELTGFLVGAVCGAILAKPVAAEPARPRSAALVAGACAAAAIACAVPLRGLSDVRPEIQRIVAIEERSTTAYRKAFEQAAKGRLSAGALAEVIEQTIVPELQAAELRLKAYRKIPAEHQPLVANAADYLRLRCESWRLRAAVVRQAAAIGRRDGEAANTDAGWRLNVEKRYRANRAAAGNAEGAERVSLAALEKIK